MDRTTEVYEAFAGEYRERNADRSVVAEQRDRFLDGLDGDRVLDVGCGPGWESATFAERGLSVLGIDLSPTFLTMARRETPEASFARMDMQRLGLADATVDGLWACASFHHVPYDRADAVLAEFSRVLRDGGVATVTCARGQAERTGRTFGDEDDRRIFPYTPVELASRAREAGFRVERLDADEEWNELVVRA